VLKVRVDNHVAKGCVRVAASHPATVGLGDLMGDITIEKATEADFLAYQQTLAEAV
jgi:NADH-quinone oxidoreductase subunit G